MTILSSNKVKFTSASTDVVGSNAPSTEDGIVKSLGETGFFVYSPNAYNIYFKSEGGSWVLYQAITEPMQDGRTFPWGANTAAFIQTSDVSPMFFVFKRTGAIEYDSDVSDATDEKDTLMVEDVTQFNIAAPSGESSVTQIGVSSHDELTNLGWDVCGHTGGAFAIVMFDANGAAIEVTAPAAGERAGKALKWTSDTELAWVTI
jgi:hypothetical protein